MATFNMAAGADDGYRYRSSAVYATVASDATGGGDATATKLYATREIDTGIYYIAVALLRFDTSSIADTDTVTAASLDLYVETDSADADSLSVVADWYDCGATQDNDDWANLTTGADAISGVALSTRTEGAVNTFDLENVTNVNKTGYTGIRIGISKLAADAAATGATKLVFASYESGNQEPRLNVTSSAAATSSSTNLLLLGVG